MPRCSAWRRRVWRWLGTPLTLETQSTLSGTAARIRIQASKAVRLNFSGLLKAQKTKASSGRPQSARLGASSAIGEGEAT